MDKTISNKGKRNRVIAVTFIIFIALSLSFYLVKNHHKKTNSSENSLKKNKAQNQLDNDAIMPNDQIQLTVPLINQNEEPGLYNGCEVSSLAMLLQYWGIDVTKNELADEITVIPFEKDGLMGDPNEGFVGSISGDDGPGYSVYTPVIVELAKKKVTKDLSVINLSGDSFDDILSELLNGNPVWVLTTTDFLAPTEFETWQTKNGTIEISWDIHSVVLTGFDSDSIYLNDPYGEKTKTDRDNFLESWEKMGSHAMTIVSKN